MTENQMKFKLVSSYQPTGDQPQTIEKLVSGINSNKKHQTLLGVTGSGKSISYDERIFITNKYQNGYSEPQLIPIGKLVDKLFQEEKIKKINETEILSSTTIKKTFETFSFNPQTGVTELKKITQFIRHKTPKKIFHLTTSCGKEIKTTGDHNFWVLRKGKLILIKTHEIKITDYLPIPQELIHNQNNEEMVGIWLTPWIKKSLYYFKYQQLVKLIKVDSEKLKKILGYSKWYHATKLNEGINLSYLHQITKPDKRLKELKIYRPRAKKLTLYQNISDEYLQLIGIYIAEGHSTSRYLLISAHELEFKKILTKILTKLKIKYKERKFNPGDFQISHSALAEIFSKWCGRLSQEKRLPPWFLSLSKTQLSILLSAYFSGDGSVSLNEVTTISASRQLISDLSYALLTFGIHARIRKKYKRATNTNSPKKLYHELVISGQKDLRTFTKQIGFTLKRKQDLLEKIILKKPNTNVDIIPLSGEIILTIRKDINLTQKSLAKKLSVTRSHISLIENNLRSPSRNLINKLTSLPEIKLSSEYHELVLLKNIFWTRVRSITKINPPSKYVYDIAVEDNETFLAGHGGLFVHNTFAIANVIEQTQKPTLVIAHNKTLAAQLYQEFRDFFPDNAVSYFVSYYDYYQPEAYIPSTDTYIEKEAQINDEIDKLRLSTTTNLLTRNDVIVVASVSCIYNLGSPVEYGRYILEIIEGQLVQRRDLLLRLSQLQYEASSTELRRGTYRLRGDTIQLWPAYEDKALRIDTLENKITKIDWIDPITGTKMNPNKLTLYERKQKEFIIYPAKHYVIDPKTQTEQFEAIFEDLKRRLKEFKDQDKVFEAHRLEQKVKYDLQMIKEFGFTNGIENYSRYFDGRSVGQPPYTLLDYFKYNAEEFGAGNFLTVMDESHMSIPQIGGMHAGDQSRKNTLVNYGFRLPSALDNRPLNFTEFQERVPQAVYVSATPREWEIEKSGEVIEQLVRPTGLLDPEIELRKTKGQIEDLIIEIIKRKQLGQRTLVTTLTKKMAEALTEYLNDQDKIKQLVESFITKRDEQQEQINPACPEEIGEKIILANGFLPIDEMEIGQIPQQYQTQAELPLEIDLRKKILYPKVAYLHSGVETLERSDILEDLRKGEYDVVVGINLLREGLDLPEVTLVAILDADKEGFLRSRISMIQTMGRAARHIEGRAILYADNLTKSMKLAIEETQRRREYQLEYNRKHNIDPKTIIKPIRDRMIEKEVEAERT
ncbi:MAG: helicase-related protein, partial [Patescibacteria group bacterium]